MSAFINFALLLINRLCPVDKSRSLKDNSVGLGLSIVEDIVNSHGGTVKLLNNPKSKGLRVSLSFPN